MRTLLTIIASLVFLQIGPLYAQSIQGVSPPIPKSNAGIFVRGQVKAKHHAVLSARISATLNRLSAHEGDRVKAGAPLARFDCTPLQAELLVAQTRRRAALTKLDVNQRLATANNLSKLDLALSEAEVELAKAEEQGIRAKLSRCSLSAPFSGVITEQHAQAHEYVAEGDPVFRLVNTKDLLIEMVVPSVWLGKLAIGTEFGLEVDELDRRVTAKILYIVGEVDAVSQTVRVVGKPVRAQGRLVPGMSGNVSFTFQPPTAKTPVTGQ